MSLSDLIRDDVSSVFFRTEDFADIVTYQRGADSCTVKAIAGDPAQVRAQVRDGRTLSARRREWLVPASEMTHMGHPKVGDLIVRGTGCNAETYRVSPVESDREWNWSDPQNRIYRIRTIQVEQ